MRVLVVSEGKHELGSEEQSSPLVELTRRLMNREVDFICEKVSSPKVKVHSSRQRGKAANYERRALRWIRYAQIEGFDVLVFLIDQDGREERETGIRNAQVHPKFALRRAMGIAIRTFDAWMLADERAISQALDYDVPRQKDPESEKNPKEICRNLRGSGQQKAGLTDLYFQIARTIDLDKLAERCSRGFAPFRKRVEEAAARL